MQIETISTRMKKSVVELLLSADLQVPYSESMIAFFEAYMQQQRWYTTPFYCLLPVVIVLTYLLLLLCTFSLHPISEGYMAGGALPLMNFIGATGCCLSVISVFIHFFPEQTYSKLKVLGVASIGGIVFVMIAALLSEICFPFPFAGLIPVNVVAPLVIGLSCWTWVPHCRTLPHFKETFVSYLVVILCLWGATMLYPGVVVMFHGMENGPILICLTLSLIRKGYEVLIIYCCNYCNRSAAFIAVFLCTGFNVVYLSTTMQSGMNTFNFIAIMAIDISVNVHSMWQLMYLKSLAEIDIGDYESKKKHSNKVFSSAAVENKKNMSETVSKERKESSNDKSLARQLLPYAEIFILTEYVECVVPLLMAIFSYVLYYHPNGKYIPRVTNMSIEELNASTYQLILYGLAEIVGLMVFLTAMNFKFPISPWTHIGCILKQKCFLVSIYLSTWLMYSFSQVLEHTASDWTFQFQCNPPPS